MTLLLIATVLMMVGVVLLVIAAFRPHSSGIQIRVESVRERREK